MCASLRSRVFAADNLAMSNSNSIKDMVGQQVGEWTVMGRAPNDKCGNAMWQCRCSCGGEKVVKGKLLRDGSSTTCGKCQSNLKLKGRTFGEWVVLRRVKSQPGESGSTWLCRCCCGKERAINAKYLIGGLTSQCGCVTPVLNAALFTADLVGKTFGDWTVLAIAEPLISGKASEGKSRKHVRWRCRCACGTEKDVLAGNLTRGLSQSCGDCARVRAWKKRRGNQGRSGRAA